MSLYESWLARMDAHLAIPPDKPEETPANTLAALWWTAAGHPRSAVSAATDPLPALDATQVAHLEQLAERRLSGEPLAYLTGRQRFLDLDMFAAAGALIPRRETEILGHAALALVRDAVARRGSATVIDVCTGSGNLPLAYAAHEPGAQVMGADLSADAIAVARTNATFMNLADRVDFRCGDLLEPFGTEWDGRVDVVSCNPPYISSSKVGTMHAEIAGHEPSLAFDGGPFGIRILTRFIKEVLRLTAPGAWICFEVGLGQGPAMSGRLEAAGAYEDIRTFTDVHGAVRALAARVKDTR